MKVVTCPRCEARNTVGGDCLMCGQPLGSIPRAFVAAFAAALVLAVAWALLVWITRVHAFWFPILFGALVSGAVAQVSFGRGWAYQAIASTATLLGIVAGETLLILLIYDRLDILVQVEQPNLAALSLAGRVAVHDPLVFAFGTCGLLGGFWVWKQPSPSEDG